MSVFTFEIPGKGQAIKTHKFLFWTKTGAPGKLKSWVALYEQKPGNDRWHLLGAAGSTLDDISKGKVHSINFRVGTSGQISAGVIFETDGKETSQILAN